MSKKYHLKNDVNEIFYIYIFFIFPYERRGSVYLGLLAQRRLPIDTLLATVRHPIVTANQ